MLLGPWIFGEVSMAVESDGGHVEATVQQLAALYEAHGRAVSPIQSLANRITAALGRPQALTIIIFVILAWMIGNLTARWLGSTALDVFPFPDLEFAATIVALLVALLILTTQRHEEELAETRARLTLQIAVLSEKKIAKIIELLEEQRRDNPLLQTRTDEEADAMARATDPLPNLEQPEATESG
jgi:uncharacterized membrane protein